MSKRLAFTIPEVCDEASASRSSVYEAIRIGELRAVKRGRRTLVLAGDLEAWVNGLPEVSTAKPAV